MTVNDAKIYIDDSPQPIGSTAYQTGIGRHCWVGEIDMNGTHTFTAKWAKAKPNRVAYEGSIVVELTGETQQLINIPTHKV